MLRLHGRNDENQREQGAGLFCESHPSQVNHLSGVNGFADSIPCCGPYHNVHLGF